MRWLIDHQNVVWIAANGGRESLPRHGPAPSRIGPASCGGPAILEELPLPNDPFVWADDDQGSSPTPCHLRLTSRPMIPSVALTGGIIWFWALFGRLIPVLPAHTGIGLPDIVRKPIVGARPSMAIHRLSREQIVYTLDQTTVPAVEIDDGDTVVFETYDARTGTILIDSDLLDHPHPIGANPATGPVLVRGAEPGDGLVVTIASIELADSGFLAVKKGEGLLAHRAGAYATRITPIVDGIVHFGDLRFPAHPMVGVIGTAPAGPGISTSYAGPHGGNMDNRYIGAGSRVHLPVAVDGALLGIGDIHAAMGDGEITFIGLEICAEVTVRIELAKGAGTTRPLVETDEHWVTTGEGEDLGDAARMAANEMVDLLQQRLGLSFEDAYMLMSAAVDVQICQCCEPGEFPVTTRAVVSRQLVP